MEKSIHVENLNSHTAYNVDIPADDQCPMCHSYLSINNISARVHSSSYHPDDILSVFCRCSKCGEFYINRYTEYNDDFIKISSEPNRFVKKDFDEKLVLLSPGFDEIYNQARQAECLNLHQIAGIGYRKALEFLIKDFAISKHPDSIEEIKNMPLSRCINAYIDNEKIKSLAIKTVWIGNDETHYVRKHTDRDINDLKKFIDAVVYFIGIDFIMLDAETVSPA
ncbi:MAG: DUF4145 domain-containing protein [Clostridia bacterium]|nr:DUF4145 domain-containing protein [Clostridia bacterium]